MTAPIAKFRVYLPRCSGRGFWDVLIFAAESDLRAHLANKQMRGGAFRAKGTVGFCRALITLTRRGGYKPNPRGSRGVVALCIPYCGVGVVTHEWVHAAHYELASHQGREPLTLKDDERLAYLAGEFVKRFWNAFYRRFKQRGRQWVLCQ